MNDDDLSKTLRQRIPALQAEYATYVETSGPVAEPDDYQDWLEFQLLALREGLHTTATAKANLNRQVDEDSNGLMRCARVGVKGMRGFMICESPSTLYEVLMMVIADGAGDHATFIGDLEAVIGITFVDMTIDDFNKLDEELDDWM